MHPGLCPLWNAGPAMLSVEIHWFFPFHWMRNYYLMSWYNSTWGKCKADRNQTKTNEQKLGMWWGPNEDLILFNSIYSPSFQKKIWRFVNILPTILWDISHAKQDFINKYVDYEDINTLQLCHSHGVYNQSFLLLIGL